MKASLVSAALALCVLPWMAHAQDYQAIAQDLYDQGFENQATIRVRSDGLYVETSGSAGTTERVYSLDGTVLREEETVTSDGRKIEREYDRQGSLVEEEIEDVTETAKTRGATVEREFAEDGTLVKEEISTPGGTKIERTYDSAGNVVSNEVTRGERDEPRGRRAGGRDRDDDRDEDEQDDDRDEDESDADDDSGDEEEDEDDGDDRGRGDNGRGNGRGRG